MTNSSLSMLIAYRVLARNLPDTTVVMYDANLNVLLAEGSDLPVLGFSYERIVGFHLYNALPGEVAARYEPHCNNALQGHRSIIEEAFGDGRSIYQLQFLPAHDDDGRIFAGMIICQNVTAQRTAEARLRESEGRNRALIRAIPDTLLVIDSVGTVIDVIQNSYVQSLASGLWPIPGINIRDTGLPQPVLRMIFDLIQNALATGKLVTGEAELNTHTAAPNHAELRCVPLGGTQVLMMIRDMTALRQAQRDLQARLDELTALHNRVSELEQLKTDMLRLGAHDLRSPLMVIMNYGRYLADDLKAMPETESQQTYVQEILESAERMLVISHDILDATRIEQLLDTSAFETIDFTEVLLSAADGLRTNAILKNHTFTVEIDDAPLHGLGDVPMLREAAGNLISNAIKYTPDGGKIAVMLKKEGGELVFSVKDNGYGVPQDTVDKLFQPLNRVGTKEARRQAGTGLGLHLVKRIVERHNGTVFFETKVKQGSTFGFRLPLT